MNKARIFGFLRKNSLVLTCRDIKKRYVASSSRDRLRLIAMVITVVIFGGVSFWGGSRIPFFGALPGMFLGVTLLYFFCPAAPDTNAEN